MDLNYCPPPYPIMPSNYDDQDQEHHPFCPINQGSSSSSSCILFNPIQHQMGLFQHQLCPLQLDHQDHNYAYNGGSSTAYEFEWKKEDHGVPSEIEWMIDANPVKWMSSKMILMQRMKKNHDRLGLNLTSTSNRTTKKSSRLNTDSSHNNSSYDDNIPIRVCTDCNTTKTPLWRSGPKGPKSLCNACGIRQRKARRTMAAAAASGVVVATDQPRVLFKIKMQHKEKATGKNARGSLLMKRCKLEKGAANIAAGSKSNGQKKLGFEDLSKKLSKNLAFQSVFPEDEKNAAILLMALSSGLLYG